MTEYPPLRSFLLGMGYLFASPVWLMLGLPSVGVHPGYWGCFWLMAAANTVGGSAALVMRSR